jgi:hypothetical protein
MREAAGTLLVVPIEYYVLTSKSDIICRCASTVNNSGYIAEINIAQNYCASGFSTEGLHNVFFRSNEV